MATYAIPPPGAASTETVGSSQYLGNSQMRSPIQHVPQNSGNWSTTLFDCNSDEETCWWSLWCCCLLSARTSASFESPGHCTSSFSFQAWAFIAWIGVTCLLVLFNAVVATVFLILGLVGYAIFKAEVRTQIRAKLSIPGTWFSDCISHSFCPCCSVAQEGREAKHRGTKILDFMTTEQLSSIDFPQAGGHGLGNTATLNDPVGLGEQQENPLNQQHTVTHEPAATNSTTPPPPPTTTTTTTTTTGGPPPSQRETTAGSRSESFLAMNLELLNSETKQLSLCSIYMLRLWAVAWLIACIFLIAVGAGLQILVLMALFVQPAIVFYLFYWQGDNRKHASIDYVLKVFMVGFFMSTTQSIVFESIFELILGAVVIGIISATGFIANPIAFEWDKCIQEGQSVTEALVPILQTSRGSWRQIVWNLFEWIDAIVVTPPVDNLHSSDNFATTGTTDTIPSHMIPLKTVDLMHNEYQDSNNNNDNDDGYSPSEVRRHIVIIVLALFIMAYVIAAGVEETMKHFSVRCCRFPAVLKDPQSVLIYLLMGALGFATAENIEYVFGTRSSPVPGTSTIVGELVVLLVRICLPIHLICSVLQATNLSKNLMGMRDMHLGWILLPAIILHGTFDFVLFLFGVIEYAYNVDDLAFEAFTVILPIIITVVGIVVAYIWFMEVYRTFHRGWQPSIGQVASNGGGGAIGAEMGGDSQIDNVL